MDQKIKKDMAELYLNRIMQIHGVSTLDIIKHSEQTIHAKVAWDDDLNDAQEIEWDIQNFDNLDQALTLAETLKSKNLISTDKFLIAEDEFAKHSDLNPKELKRAIDTLLKIRVDMIDGRQRTDYFFLHF